MDKLPMTSRGLNRLQEELKTLKAVERPQVIRALEEARAHGDLSENAEYHAAKERQAFIEGRVAELEDKIARAEVIDVSKLSGSIVRFGATVTLVDEDTVLPAVPLWWGTLDPVRAESEIDHLGGASLATDWGARLMSDRSQLYDPLSYHYGSVWGLFTGWSSVAGSFLPSP